MGDRGWEIGVGDRGGRQGWETGRNVGGKYGWEIGRYGWEIEDGRYGWEIRVGDREIRV